MRVPARPQASPSPFEPHASSEECPRRPGAPRGRHGFGLGLADLQRKPRRIGEDRRGFGAGRPHRSGHASRKECPCRPGAPRGPSWVRPRLRRPFPTFSESRGARGPAGGAPESSASNSPVEAPGQRIERALFECRTARRTPGCARLRERPAEPTTARATSSAPPAPRTRPCPDPIVSRNPNRTNKNGPLVAEGAIDLAAFYSPTGSPLQYHRRWKA